MNDIIEVNIKHLQQHKICQLIDLAGFSTKITGKHVTLMDKNNDKAYLFSDLTYNSLYDAAIAIEPYLKNQYKFI